MTLTEAELVVAEKIAAHCTERSGVVWLEQRHLAALTARVRELEGKLRVAEAGWAASQHALRHARGEACEECNGA